MSAHLLVAALVWLLPAFVARAAAAAMPASTYNVVWDLPSPDAWESMPLSGCLAAGATGTFVP